MSFVQEFLRQAFYLDENAEHANQKATGGLQAAPSYDATADATAIDRAIKAKGVDEATITNILTKRNNAQRQAIEAAYKSSTGKPLEDALKKALSGKYEEVVLALLKTPAEFDAQELKHATKGLGTDEEVLIEILASRTNKELREINRVYKELYKNDLAKDITSDTSGDFQKALLALAKGDRSEDARVNDELVDNDARALYDAGEKKKGTNVSVFINILTTRSFGHLQKVFQKYTKYSKHDVNKALDLELKGDIEKCLTAIVKCATSRAAFFAEKLNLSMKGLSTMAYQSAAAIDAVLSLLLLVRGSHLQTNIRQAEVIRVQQPKNDGCKAHIARPCHESTEANIAEIAPVQEGSGTRHKDLIRVMVSRSEVDMNEIKAHYKRMYGTSLHQAILDDTKGDYETILLALCGGE